MKFKLTMLVTLLLSSILHAGSTDYFMNRDARINEDGKITMSRYLGKIPIGNGDVLPLVMNFKSDMDPSPTSLVPKHEIPLLEAKAVTINETNSRVLLPNGEAIYLRRKSSKHSYETDLPWTVKIDGPRLLLSDGESEWVYVKGRIASWKTAENDGVKWVYDQSGLKSLNRYGGAEILSVQKTSTDLKLGLGGRSSAVNWKLVQVGEGEGLRWIPLMNSYSTLDGDEFFVSGSVENSSLMEIVKDSEGNRVLSFSHDYLSGDIKSMNGRKVTVKNMKGFSTPQITIGTAENTEIIHTARFRGGDIAKELLADGSVKESMFVLTPKGRKLRKVILKNAGGEELLYRAYYDAHGDLLMDTAGEHTRKFMNGIIHVYKNKKLIRKY